MLWSIMYQHPKYKQQHLYSKKRKGRKTNHPAEQERSWAAHPSTGSKNALSQNQSEEFGTFRNWEHEHPNKSHPGLLPGGLCNTRRFCCSVRNKRIFSISAAGTEWKETWSLWQPDNSTFPLRLVVGKFEKSHFMTSVKEEYIKSPAILKQNPWKHNKPLNLAPFL